MYAQSPAYFNQTQTTYGIKKIGPTAPMTQRHHQLGTLSVDGRLIPAPVHSALSGIHLGSANGEGEGMAPWMTYTLYGAGGVALGLAIYFGLKKFDVI